jgi:hypothetical protein
MDVHRSFNFVPNRENIKLITIWVNDITPEKVDLCCMYQKLIGFQVVTDFYKTRKVFDDTIVKQPVTLGNIDFSENFSEQLVDHIYKDKEYFWCDGNPYKSLGEITEGILKRYRAHHSSKTVQFDTDSQKIIGKESGTIAFPEDVPMNRLWMKKGADSEPESDSDSDSENKISV